MSYLQAFSVRLFGSQKSDPVPIVKPNYGMQKIKDLCDSVRWARVEDCPCDCVVIQFKDSIFFSRDLRVAPTASGEVAVFCAHSNATFPPEEMPSHLAAHVLIRNATVGFASWQLRAKQDGRVRFSLFYTVLLGSLDASYFRIIGDSMIVEASSFDAKLRADGLL